MPLWQMLFYNRILPSVFDAAASLLFVFLIFKIFKVKNPATRHMFLFVPLIKPLIIFLDSSAVFVSTQEANKPFQIGIRMPDPFDLISLQIKEVGALSYDHSTFAAVIALATILALILIAVRWIQLFLFLRKFSRDGQISRSDYPELYSMLDRLASNFSIPSPRLVFSNNFEFVPVSIGGRKPLIVLSERLLKNFSNEQLEIMLAHELAHIKRKDSLTGWIAIIAQDMMFFNPLIRLAYSIVDEEKECACDRMVIAKTQASPIAVGKTLLDVALYYSQIQSSQNFPHPALAKSFFQKSSLKRRVKALTEPIKTVKSSRLKTISIYICIFLFIYIQPMVVIYVNGTTVFLR